MATFIVSSHKLCGVSFEHAESVSILTASGKFMSSLSVLRCNMKHTRQGILTLYAASGEAVNKLPAGLTHTSAKVPDKVPTSGVDRIQLDKALATEISGIGGTLRPM